MPKIRITETDYTSNISYNGTSNVVYIPGPSSIKEKGKYVNVEPTLFTTKTDLENTDKYDKEHLSFRLAEYLLTLGLSVLYEGLGDNNFKDELKTIPMIDWDRLSDKNEYDIRFLTLGGYSIKDSGMINCARKREDCVALVDHPMDITKLPEQEVTGITEKDDNYVIAYKSTEDTNTFKVTKDTDTGVITVKGNVNTEGYVPTVTIVDDDGSLKWVVDFKETNINAGDTFIPSGSSLVGVEQTESEGDVDIYEITISTESVESKIEVRCYIGTCGRTNLVSNSSSEVAIKVKNYFKTINTRYASCFTPAFKTTEEELLKENQKEETIPASFGYLFCYARAIVNNPEWLAVSGSIRGVVSELSSITVKYTSADIDFLGARSDIGEEDNVGVAINPIANIKPFGYIIYGNRTAEHNNGTVQATDLLNVRNLLSSLKKAIYKSAKKYTFEPNDDRLWANFTNEFIPLLERMQTGRGILGYRIVKKNNTGISLSAKVILIPIQAVEDFYIDIEVSDTIEITE